MCFSHLIVDQAFWLGKCSCVEPPGGKLEVFWHLECIRLLLQSRLWTEACKPSWCGCLAFPASPILPPFPLLARMWLCWSASVRACRAPCCFLLSCALSWNTALLASLMLVLFLANRTGFSCAWVGAPHHCTGVSPGVWVLYSAMVAGVGWCGGLGPSSSHLVTLHLV